MRSFTERSVDRCRIWSVYLELLINDRVGFDHQGSKIESIFVKLAERVFNTVFHSNFNDYLATLDWVCVKDLINRFVFVRHTVKVGVFVENTLQWIAVPQKQFVVLECWHSGERGWS